VGSGYALYRYFQEKGKEVRLVYGGKYEIGISKFQQGTAELLVKEYLSMLNQLYKTRN